MSKKSKKSKSNVVALDPSKNVGKGRNYVAGSSAPRLSSWVTPSTDATAAIVRPSTIRNRARDLVRNNPWAARGLAALVNNAIGFGIICQFQTKSKARKERVLKAWRAWAETAECDADGKLNFYGLQKLVFRTIAESGEVLIRRRIRRAEDGLTVPMQIQVMECDHIADVFSHPDMPAGNYIERGIEFDPIGRRTAYYLYRVHPGSERIQRKTDITRVPADEIVHLFRVDRPGQQRGVSWFAPVIVPLRDLAIYEDAVLKRQQLSNLFAGFIRTDDPNATYDEMDEEIPDLQPGTIYMLKPGRTIEWSNPPPASEDVAYRDSQLRKIAAGLGITYEAQTGNLSEVNFSSGRMGAQEMSRNVESWQWDIVIPGFCQTVFKWFSWALSLEDSGLSEVTAEWTPPARIIVDPTKEFTALMTAVRAGLISLPEAIRMLGYDPDTVLAEQEEFLKKLDAAGIKVESDFRNLIKQASNDNQIPKA